MTNLKAARVGNRDKSVRTEVYTSTIHHIHVDLTSLLSQFDPTDQVVLHLDTPSGRPKRVTVPGHLLISPEPTPYVDPFN